ncbi:short chain dehydrogenase family protein [Mycobacterium xenopi 4042]|uniref:Short chain dehydrogenase family protein n=1 Tax=Mycobacterium xenopi 4042 TaxID=1299334 RepID=X8APD2_MYCXE|nr:short chain dehydrogenase family protein [Mycobacterium xenopi 4042]
MVTVDGDKAVAVCESLLVVHRDGGYTVWRPGANHFELRRIDHRWQITARVTRPLDGARRRVSCSPPCGRDPGERDAGGQGRVGNRAGRHREGIARRFAAEGARIVVAEIDAAAGQAVARDIGGVFVGTDVANRSEVENAVQTALSEYGSIDIVVNNAWGGGKIGRVENKTDEQLAHGIAVGYYGPYWAMRAAFPT